MIIKKIFPYFLVFLLLIVDITCTIFFEEAVLHTLAIFYCFLLFRTTSISLLGTTACALALESFLYLGRFGPIFLILVPLTLFFSHLGNNFNLSKIGPFLVLLGYLGMYWGIMEPLLLGSSSIGLYTSAKIGANILLMTVFY